MEFGRRMEQGNEERPDCSLPAGTSRRLPVVQSSLSEHAMMDRFEMLIANSEQVMN
jgi:hypothetical protein